MSSPIEKYLHYLIFYTEIGLEELASLQRREER